MCHGIERGAPSVERKPSTTMTIIGESRGKRLRTSSPSQKQILEDPQSLLDADDEVDATQFLETELSDEDESESTPELKPRSSQLKDVKMKQPNVSQVKVEFPISSFV